MIIKNARVVTADEIVRGSVHVRDGFIASIDAGTTGIPGAVDFDGDFLLPGLVELHTDNFERHLMPRPKVRWPEMPALLAHDAEIAAAGITTVYDALGVGDVDDNALRGGDMRDIVACLGHALTEGLLRAEHRLHVRCELPAPNAIELFAPFDGHPLVGLLSLMDHTPGQRQWTQIEPARVYYTGKKGWSNDKFVRRLAEAPLAQERYAQPHRRYFAAYARNRGIPLASHDDTTAAHVGEAHRDGIVISEFPTSAEAALAARSFGMSIVMGAPNVVRGGSHSGNVAAIDLAQQALLDSLSSDYVPSSLLLAAFVLEREAGLALPRSIAMVSRNPAHSVGLDDRGEITVGRRADLVQVKTVGSQPVVRAVWRAGHRIN